MKVCILGGTGYVGLPVACAFARAGHETAAMVRDRDSSELLAAEEVSPIPWSNFESTVNSFDIIVDCLNHPPSTAHVIKTVANASRTAPGRRHHPIAYIYTSGVWVHGSSDGENCSSGIVDERSGTGMEVGWYSDRATMEHNILSSTDILPIVIRPGLIYGRNMGLLNKLFTSAWAGAIYSPSRPGTRWSTIHVDDLSDLYVRVAESAPSCERQCFDACNMQSESADDVIRQVQRVTGCMEVWYMPPRNEDDWSIQTSLVTRPSLARSIVGWAPKKLSLTDGMDMYWMAWQAMQMRSPVSDGMTEKENATENVEAPEEAYEQPHVQHQHDARLHPQYHNHVHQPHAHPQPGPGTHEHWQHGWQYQHHSHSQPPPSQSTGMGLIQFQQLQRAQMAHAPGFGARGHSAQAAYQSPPHTTAVARRGQQQVEQRIPEHHIVPHIPPPLQMPTPISVPSPSQAVPPPGVLTPPGSTGYNQHKPQSR
ncbi:NAD(P)-binding protein [Calocera cornea HHB12733]|uniref:NAD(P)-binding protein n=1 Tax=Calocera cornea HHB12733 TaxID=1353952 RepID=A0A165GB96_9BASI|nr:NAD(P)-binding protein [Calocera cornea HHB12733]